MFCRSITFCCSLTSVKRHALLRARGKAVIENQWLRDRHSGCDVVASLREAGTVHSDLLRVMWHAVSHAWWAHSIPLKEVPALILMAYADRLEIGGIVLTRLASMHLVPLLQNAATRRQLEAEGCCCVAQLIAICAEILGACQVLPLGAADDGIVTEDLVDEASVDEHSRSTPVTPPWPLDVDVRLDGALRHLVHSAPLEVLQRIMHLAPLSAVVSDAVLPELDKRIGRERQLNGDAAVSDTDIKLIVEVLNQRAQRAVKNTLFGGTPLHPVSGLTHTLALACDRILESPKRDFSETQRLQRAAAVSDDVSVYVRLVREVLDPVFGRTPRCDHITMGDWRGAAEAALILPSAPGLLSRNVIRHGMHSVARMTVAEQCVLVHLIGVVGVDQEGVSADSSSGPLELESLWESLEEVARSSPAADAAKLHVAVSRLNRRSPGVSHRLHTILTASLDRVGLTIRERKVSEWMHDWRSGLHDVGWQIVTMLQGHTTPSAEYDKAVAEVLSVHVFHSRRRIFLITALKIIVERKLQMNSVLPVLRLVAATPETYVLPVNVLLAALRLVLDQRCYAPDFVATVLMRCSASIDSFSADELCTFALAAYRYALNSEGIERDVRRRCEELISSVVALEDGGGETSLPVSK